MIRLWHAEMSTRHLRWADACASLTVLLGLRGIGTWPGALGCGRLSENAELLKLASLDGN